MSTGTRIALPARNAGLWLARLPAAPYAAGTFDAGVRVSQAGDGRHQAAPAIMCGPEGNVYVAWVMWEPGQAGRVCCARAIDGGVSFESPCSSATQA